MLRPFRAQEGETEEDAKRRLANWASLVLDLRAERARAEKGLPGDESGPTVLSENRLAILRSAYAGLYAFGVWQAQAQRARDNREEPPPKPDWTVARHRTTLDEWNATFGPAREDHSGWDEIAPRPSANDWNPRTYAAPDLPGMDENDWGVI